MLDDRLAWARPRVVTRRLRRVVSAEIIFAERNHDITKTLLILGSGRSGSTWLSEILVEALRCRLIFEPLRRDRVRLSRDVPWGSYVDPAEEAPELHRVLRRILTGRVRNPLADSFNAYRFPQRRIVKEIRAMNLLPWIRAQFPQVPVIYLLRHPVAASWSATQLQWKPYLSEFLGQDQLMDGPLAPWRQVISRHSADGDLLQLHMLRWCMENLVPTTQLAPAAVHVVFYEDLVQDPFGELRRLADYLGCFGRGTWAFDPAAPLTVDRPSRTNFRDTPVMPASQRLQSWLTVLPRPRVQRAVGLLAEFGLDRLYGTAARPCIPAGEVLPAGPVQLAAGSSATACGR